VRALKVTHESQDHKGRGACHVVKMIGLERERHRKHDNLQAKVHCEEQRKSHDDSFHTHEDQKKRRKEEEEEGLNRFEIGDANSPTKLTVTFSSFSYILPFLHFSFLLLSTSLL